jgi:peptidoglycan L-alanyl-D-glutamate endopeptidase CwlK
MPYFSVASLDQLATCHEDLRTLFHEVIRHVDCKVLEGHRTLGRQQELYAKGRMSPGRIVTYKDGILRKSKHQSDPSIAVDVVPYPINWRDREKFYHLAGFVKATAIALGIDLRWGGDWQSFQDLPHYELAQTDSA